MTPLPAPPFAIHGPMPPARPTIVAVPHAGRDYPEALLAAARVQRAVLERLEDRHVDALAVDAIAAGTTVIVAQLARAYIDLNRSEEDWDGALVADAEPPASIAKRVHGGLGIVPRRLHPVGELWRRRMTHAELAERIDTVHRPYHVAIAAALTAARRGFGHAVLLDLHSMPPQPGGTPQFVIGDRHGSSASHELVDRLLATADGHGLSVARNIPYAGAYGVERHGRPAAGQEAVQIEFDRGLYCDRQGDPVPQQVARLAQLLAQLVRVADQHVLGRRASAIAAE